MYRVMLCVGALFFSSIYTMERSHSMITRSRARALEEMRVRQEERNKFKEEVISRAFRTAGLGLVSACCFGCAESTDNVVLNMCLGCCGYVCGQVSLISGMLTVRDYQKSNE